MSIFEQVDLFGEIETKMISIDESALLLGVSSATIRNWLKAGYLKSVSRGQITEESLKYFQDNVAGKEKLNQRANKSQKDLHNQHSITSEYLAKIQSDRTQLCRIGSDYESSLSDSYRNKEGIYYTPPDVVLNLFSVTQGSVQLATFCDPCCGSGNFIIRALELGFKPENIYGYDVDPVAVEITKARIYEFCGYRSSNIKVSDFLNIACCKDSLSYDYIYTNPPWGKKLPKNEKHSLGTLFRTGSSKDTCSLFFFACLKCLNSKGMLGLLMPESFFNISTFEFARLKALQLSIVKLVDYGKAFKGLVTKAQGIVIRNIPTVPKQKVTCENLNYCYERSMESFSANPKSIINFCCDGEDAETLAHLMTIPHINMTGRATWGLGIVTGNNKKFIEDFQKEGHIPVFKGSDISQTELKAPSCFIPSNLSLYQQVAPLRLFEAKEKLIYKFISSRLCFFHDTDQRFVLNSANMLIPNDDFPISTKVLGGLLSSDFMNWVFARIFNTHKVLRGDIESLPIHSQFLTSLSHFDEESYLKQLLIERTSNGTYRTKG